MEATLEQTSTGLLCPSCEKPMAFTEATHSYRCHACNPIPENVPICATQKCKLPLTRLGDPWNCWICLKCNKHPEEVNKMQKEEDERKRTYLDKKVTSGDVQKIVDAAVAKALAEQRPVYPPSQAEIQTMTSPETINAKPVIASPLLKAKGTNDWTWLQKAKQLGVQTHNPNGGGMRKKVEIMADIEKVEAKVEAMTTPLETDEESEKEAKAFSEKAQSPPGEDDEHARGLTEADMM